MKQFLAYVKSGKEHSIICTDNYEDILSSYQVVEAGYTSKSEFAKQLRANGYKVCFIATSEEDYGIESYAYNWKVSKAVAKKALGFAEESEEETTAVEETTEPEAMKKQLNAINEVHFNTLVGELIVNGHKFMGYTENSAIFNDCVVMKNYGTTAEVTEDNEPTEQENVTESKKTIKLTEEAYIEGYEGAFLREVDAYGYKLATGIWNNWYTAAAEDSEGNGYMVYWKLREDFNPAKDEDEGDACKWDEPYMVLDEDYKNVIDSVELAL